MIELISSWSIFLSNAREYENKNEKFYSPKEGAVYRISDTQNDIIRIQRMDVEQSEETIGIGKLRTCMERINEMYPSKIKKGSIYEHVVEETTLVELLPFLDWSEDKKSIVFLRNLPDETGELDLAEAPNDDLNDKIIRALTVRRGQKKLRLKLLYLYQGKCAITKCPIEETLHACHIMAHSLTGNNLSTNALLLRSDIHDLFDSDTPINIVFSVNNSF